MTLEEAVRALAKVRKPTDNVFYGLVKSVDKPSLTCEVEPLDGDALVLDVRLSADTAQQGFIIYPKVGSVVAVVMESEAAGFVGMVSEVDRFTFKTENENLKDLLADLLTAIKAITVQTGVGPSGTPINMASFIEIENRLNNFFE